MPGASCTMKTLPASSISSSPCDTVKNTIVGSRLSSGTFSVCTESAGS